MCNHVRQRVLEGLCEILGARATLCVFPTVAQLCVQISGAGMTVSECPSVGMA